MTKPHNALGATCALAVLLAALAGCQKQEGPAEEAGRKLDNAVEQVGKDADKARESVGEKIEQAGERIQDAAKDDDK